MKIATKIVSPPNNLQGPKSSTQYRASISHSQNISNNKNSNNLSFKVTSSWGQNGKFTSTTTKSLVSKAKSLRGKWMELQGIKNWEGLLDPLDDGLRDEILRYGQFVEAAYRCFEFDASSPGYARCRYPRGSMLSQCGLGATGYKVTRCLHATCGVHLPGWADHRVPNWASARSSWIGYVAVCNDRDEIDRLGRRDVVIAYRGTATCMEWLENLRATLTALPDDMARGDREPMVQSGFLSLYTSAAGGRPSLQDSVRDEVRRIIQKHGDEPLSITVTGHSLGAALATLTAHDIRTEFGDAAPLVTAVSFGGPRVGNKQFRRRLERGGRTKVLRIVNSEDPITKVPGFVLNEATSRQVGEMRLLRWVQKCAWVYAEIGRELRLSSRDCPDLDGGGVATCHDLKTYLHLLDNCPLRAAAKRVLLSTSKPEKQQIFCS